MFEIYQQGSVHVLHGSEPLNSEHVPQVEKLCADRLPAARPRLVFDLRTVPLLDSAGLEWLLALRDRYQQAGGAVLLSGPSALCRDILSASGVAEEFAIFDRLTEAVASYSQ